MVTNRPEGEQRKIDDVCSLGSSLSFLQYRRLRAVPLLGRSLRGFWGTDMRCPRVIGFLFDLVGSCWYELRSRSRSNSYIVVGTMNVYRVCRLKTLVILKNFESKLHLGCFDGIAKGQRIMQSSTNSQLLSTLEYQILEANISIAPLTNNIGYL